MNRLVALSIPPVPKPPAKPTHDENQRVNAKSFGCEPAGKDHSAHHGQHACAGQTSGENADPTRKLRRCSALAGGASAASGKSATGSLVPAAEVSDGHVGASFSH